MPFHMHIAKEAQAREKKRASEREPQKLMSLVSKRWICKDHLEVYDQQKINFKAFLQMLGKD